MKTDKELAEIFHNAQQGYAGSLRKIYEAGLNDAYDTGHYYSGVISLGDLFERLPESTAFVVVQHEAENVYVVNSASYKDIKGFNTDYFRRHFKLLRGRK